MDPVTIVTAIAGIINTAVQLGPQVIKVVEDAVPFAETIYNNLIQGNDITQAQLTALEQQIAALSVQLQAPVPPESA